MCQSRLSATRANSRSLWYSVPSWMLAAFSRLIPPSETNICPTDDARRQREKVGDQTIPSTNIDLSTRLLHTAPTWALGKLLVSLCQQRREAYHDATFLQTERKCVSEDGQRNNVVEIVHGFALQEEVPVRPCVGVFPLQRTGSRKRPYSGYSRPISS